MHRNGQHKYVDSADGRPQLFKIQEDPAENRDLADASTPEVRSLPAEMERRLRSTSDHEETDRQARADQDQTVTLRGTEMSKISNFM